MKTKIALFFCMLAVVVHAQPYGHTRYPNGADLTCGIRTSLNTDGFLFVGNGMFTPPLGTPYNRLQLDKTDVGGAFNAAPGEFQVDYMLTETNNFGCGYASGVLTTNFYGASIVETVPTGVGDWYALVGAYNGGCFYSALDMNGGVLYTAMYPFPYQSVNVTKPLITRSVVNSDYYITGRFDTAIYVARVNQSGSLQWSSFYAFGHTIVNNQLFGGITNPKQIIESPHNNNVIVVGDVQGSPSFNRAQDGFFLELDPANGNVKNFKSYGNYANLTGSCTRFNAIAPAYSTSNGGNGYVIGGYSDFYGTTLQNTGHCWMLKINQAGDIGWNSILTPGSDNFAGNVVAVTERQGATNYEYYGLSDMVTVNGMVVLKLDDNGAPVSGVNEFHYNPTTATGVVNPINLTYKNGGPNDEGLHLYASFGGNPYLTEAYFNGISGCNENLTAISAIETGGDTINPWTNKYGSLGYCLDFDLTSVANQAYTTNQYCSNASVLGGSNVRSMATSILSWSDPAKEYGVYPNPTHDRFTIESNPGSKMMVYNTAGQVLFERTLGGEKTEVDLAGHSKGLYLVRIRDGGRERTIRLVKE